MNPSKTLACITCEFESIDLADLGIGRLIKTTGGVRSIHVRRCIPPKHAPDLVENPSVLPTVYPVVDNSPAYLYSAAPGLFLASADKDPRDTIEPRRIRSVTAEIICNQNNVREVAGRLTSLGATHIRIR